MFRKVIEIDSETSGFSSIWRPHLMVAVLRTEPEAIAVQRPLFGIVDTGASRSTMPSSILDPAIVPRLLRDEVRMANGKVERLPTINAQIRLHFEAKTVFLEGLFVTNAAYMLLGCDLLAAFDAKLVLNPGKRSGKLLIPTRLSRALPQLDVV